MCMGRFRREIRVGLGFRREKITTKQVCQHEATHRTVMPPPNTMVLPSGLMATAFTYSSGGPWSVLLTPPEARSHTLVRVEWFRSEYESELQSRQQADSPHCVDTRDRHEGRAIGADDYTTHGASVHTQRALDFT